MDETQQKHFVVSGATTKRSNLHKLITETYKKVAYGILLTGLVSIGTTYLIGDKLGSLKSGTFLGGFLASFLLLIVLSVRIRTYVKRRENTKATYGYYLVAAAVGFIMTIPFSYYSLGSIGAAFVISSALFLGLARFGTTTDKDFISWGRVLLMFLIGAVVISLLGIFVNFGTMNIVIDVGIMMLFSAYIIYDSNQLIKRNQDVETQYIPGISTLMALELYLDFINLFQRVLAIVGNRN